MLTMLAALGVAAVAVAPAASAAPQVPPSVPCDTVSPTYSYVVLYEKGTPGQVPATEMAYKCGKLVAYYPEIGVAVASSRNTDFAEKLGADRAYSARKDVKPPTKSALTSATRSAASAGEDLSGQQWDMDMIGAKEANKINRGSATVTVAVMDNGIDASHPDLAAAVDAGKSVGCLSGKADGTPSSWAATNHPHGTHIAGTIAAADDGSGITGIAPGVRLASVRIVGDDGLIMPEAAVCGFMWSGKNHFKVANNSLYVDPFLHYCDNKPGESVAFEAVRRAVEYSTNNGVLTVSVTGNGNQDDTKPVRDGTPLDPNHCKRLPAQLPDAIAVSAVTYDGVRAFYSNWGGTYLTAPGGDPYVDPPAGKGPGCPLSTVIGGGYGYKGSCGTSMATPHVVGVAALLASKHPNADVRELRKLLREQATPVACPANEANCTGSTAYNSYYGYGLVNALAAVTD
nr:secreted subtilisin-like protease [Kibdelosporangium sp. MJ126-NF4]CTQ98199.1 secreted subtilisin-like protease [Kibdelosporangium sp. MJ126-NF4]